MTFKLQIIELRYGKFDTETVCTVLMKKWYILRYGIYNLATKASLEIRFPSCLISPSVAEPMVKFRVCIH